MCIFEFDHVIPDAGPTRASLPVLVWSVVFHMATASQSGSQSENKADVAQKSQPRKVINETQAWCQLREYEASLSLQHKPAFLTAPSHSDVRIP